MSHFNPFRCESEVTRHLSVVLSGIALLAWIVWVGMASDGFSQINPAGWLVFFGAPVAIYAALWALLPVLRKASTVTRYVLSACAMWLFFVASWGYIWRWQSEFSLEQYIALFFLPPVGLCLGLLLWRWSKAR